MSEAVREVPKKERPQFRNIHVTELSNYRMAVGAIVSILHRISGFIIFALLLTVLRRWPLPSRSAALAMMPRRAGDIAESFADASKAAKELGWKATRNLQDMVADTWRWQSNHPNGYSR